MSKTKKQRSQGSDPLTALEIPLNRDSFCYFNETQFAVYGNGNVLVEGQAVPIEEGAVRVEAYRTHAAEGRPVNEGTTATWDIDKLLKCQQKSMLGSHLISNEHKLSLAKFMQSDMGYPTGVHIVRLDEAALTIDGALGAYSGAFSFREFKDKISVFQKLTTDFVFNPDPEPWFRFWVEREGGVLYHNPLTGKKVSLVEINIPVFSVHPGETYDAYLDEIENLVQKHKPMEEDDLYITSSSSICHPRTWDATEVWRLDEVYSDPNVKFRVESNSNFFFPDKKFGLEKINP